LPFDGTTAAAATAATVAQIEMTRGYNVLCVCVGLFSASLKTTEKKAQNK